MATAAIPATPASSPTSSTNGEVPKSFSEILEASAPNSALTPGADPGMPTTASAASQGSPIESFSATAGSATSRAKFPNFKSPDANPGKTQYGANVPGQPPTGIGTVVEQPVPTPIASSTSQSQLTALGTENAEINEVASAITSASHLTGSQGESKQSGFTPPEATSSNVGLDDPISASSSNAKTNDSQKERAALSSTPASGLLDSKIQTPKATPDSSIGLKSTGKAADLKNHAPSDNATTAYQSRSNDVAPAGQTGNSIPSVVANATTPDAKQSAAANLVAGESATASDPGTQSSSVSTPPRDISSNTNNNNDDASRTPAPAKSEADPAAVQLSVIPASLTFPFAATAATGATNSPTNSPGSASLSATLSAPISPRITAASTRVKPEMAGTGNKTTEASSSTKIQSRQEPSARGDSQTSDQNGSNVPSKAGDTSLSFSAAGSLLAAASGESSKNANPVLSPATAEPQSSQLEREATGLTPHPSQAETPAAYPTSLINSAKLVERIGETELRLGMRTGEFGNVDIRTSMVRNQFSAEISVERGELGRVMAADLPGLQSRLSEQRVTVANITVQDHAGNPSTASEQQKPHEGQPEGQSKIMNTANSAGMRDRDDDRVPAVVASEGTSMLASRLDIHM